LFNGFSPCQTTVRKQQSKSNESKSSLNQNISAVQENNATPAAGPYPHLPILGNGKERKEGERGKRRKGEGRNEGRKVGKGREGECHVRMKLWYVPFQISP